MKAGKETKGSEKRKHENHPYPFSFLRCLLFSSAWWFYQDQLFLFLLRSQHENHPQTEKMETLPSSANETKKTLETKRNCPKTGSEKHPNPGLKVARNLPGKLSKTAQQMQRLDTKHTQICFKPDLANSVVGCSTASAYKTCTEKRHFFVYRKACCLPRAGASATPAYSKLRQDLF